MARNTDLFISYSANNEDVLLNRIFRGKNVGFYVDVGAAHPTFENDTKALYDRGWSGINVEPNNSFFDILHIERPRDSNLNIAVSEVAGDVLFFEVIGTGLSTCDPDEAKRATEKGFEVVQRIVRTQTLRDLLEAARPASIDLLKIDVEGFEPNVIRSNDWTSFRPNVVLAEATFPETPLRRPNIVGRLLEQEGYRHVYFDGLNDYYFERDFTGPAGVFDTPVNIFDQFIPLVQVTLRDERDFLAVQLASSEAIRTATEEELVQARRDVEATQALMAALKDQMRASETARMAAEEDLARAKNELITMHTRMTALGDQLTNSDAAYADMLAQATALRQSTSWRITRPLRALVQPRKTLKFVSSRIRRIQFR